MFLNLSCSKNDCLKYYWGNANALKNAIPWTADIRAANNTLYQGKIDIIIDKFISSCNVGDGLGFQNIPSISGRYRLYKIDANNQDPAKTIAYFSTTVGGDATCDWYNVVEMDSVNNYIQVDSFDPGTGKVSGIFSAKLTVEMPKCDPSAPDTLFFSNGVFYTKVFN